MRYIEGNRTCYICGVPNYYAVKSTGNNRIIARISTLEEARIIVQEKLFRESKILDN